MYIYIPKHKKSSGNVISITKPEGIDNILIVRCNITVVRL